MTATEKLRAMLDERGVKWSGPNTRTTLWCGFEAVVVEESNGDLSLTCFTSPEQAIAATLGAGTCEWCKDGKTFDGQTVMMTNHGWQGIRHCPNCGRRLLK